MQVLFIHCGIAFIKVDLCHFNDSQTILAKRSLRIPSE